MNKRITFLFFMITTISFSQSAEKWKRYIKKENERKFEKYYFTFLENAHQNKYKVVKNWTVLFVLLKMKVYDLTTL